jgi:hypothetical protein
VAISYVACWLPFSPTEMSAVHQQPILEVEPVEPAIADNSGPIFKPPTGAPSGPGSDLVCDYSETMRDWYSCSTEHNRECWLRHPNGSEYNIHTDYEAFAPVGTTRNYTFILTNRTINADGLNFTEGNVINDQFPGPWIQACWGDVGGISLAVFESSR